jgi:hypothetical protein
MNKRTLSLCLACLLALTAGGCPEGGDIGRLIGSISPPGNPADFTISAVSIGPAPAQPGAGTLTVTVVYELNQPGGLVSIVIWLYDDDGFLRFADDELVAVTLGEAAATTPGPYSMATSFTLQCGGPDNDEVVAAQGGTGEGHDVFLVGIDEAEIKAAARREVNPAEPVTSDIVEMWCE